MIRITIPFLLVFSLLSAAVVNVPGDHATIQAGIDASVDGDTVLVAQGNYVENLILEKEIVLASHAIYDDLDSEWFNNDHVISTRIIGGSPSNSKKGSCIQVSYGNIQPTIMGFTISQGLGTSMLLTDCDIVRAERSGGAIMAFQAYPVISHNRFMNNGVSMFDEDNAVQAIQNGGAITLYDDDDVEFDEDRDNSGRTTTDSRDVPDTWNVQNNYFENNSSGNGENFYAHGYAGTIDVSGSVFEDIDCEQGTVNEFVLHSVEDEAVYVTNDISGACLDQNVFYVNPASGDDQNSGTEEDPFMSIRHALTMIRKGDDNTTIINLSAGEYSFENNGEIFPIVLPDNVHLIGDERETTILDANANQDEEASVMIIPECENVKVASMTLTNGYSEGHGCTGGGGLLITADDIYDMNQSPKESTPIIENLIIEGNHSHNGGGLSFFNVDGPIVSNIQIRNNQCTFQGGGLYSYVSNVTLSDIEVVDNQSLGYADASGLGNGGGMMLIATGGIFTNITVSDNISPSFGGGIWASGESLISTYNSFPEWSISNATVSGNEATYGGGFALSAWGNQEPSLSNITISDNSTSMSGGGLWLLQADPILTDCAIIENSSGNTSGGLLAWTGSWPTITDCIFSGNIANSNGGAMMLDGDGATLTRVAVINNESGSYVGGIGIDGIPATLDNVTVSGNTCVGGFFGNGGAIGVDNGGVAEIKNSIIWDNSGDEIWPFDGTANIEYSNIQGGWDGDGNIASDPLYNNVNAGDYTLSYDSPCIDAGTSDLDGDGVEDITQYNGSAPDMGAYESQMAAPSGLTIYPMETYVSLTWDPTTEEGFQYYLLERSTDVEFAENVVANYVTTNYYEDSSLEYDTEYFYRVSFFNGEWSEVSDPVSISLEFMSVDGDQLPDVFALHQNYPNPFNPVTNLSYDLPEDALVNITIYDMMGKVVSTLVNGQQSAGFKTLQWNATNNSGMPISAGLYIYTIQADEFHQTRKMILLK